MSQGLERVFAKTGGRARGLARERRIKFRLYIGAGLFVLGLIVSVIGLLNR